MSSAAYREAEGALFAAHGLHERREHVVAVPALGSSIRVVEIGAASEPAVVFLHGSPNAGAVWAPLVAGLGGLRCVLVDGPGFGLSELPPAGVTLRSHSATVTAALDALAIEEAHLVASSYGSGVALRFALDQPARARSIVHMGCPGVLPESPALGFGTLMSILWGAFSLKVGGTEAIWRAIGHGQSLTEGRFPASVLAWYRVLMRETTTDAANSALTKALMDGFKIDVERFATRAEVMSCATRTSLFWGTADTFGGEDAAHALKALLPRCELELLAGGGHLPWLDAPERAATHVRHFVS